MKKYISLHAECLHTYKYYAFVLPAKRHLP